MFKTLGLVLLALITALLIYAAVQPDSFRVERTASIKAPPEKIFPLINDFHRWQAWSPWEKLDPAMKRTYSGAASGKGAVYAWEGTGQVGAGSMEIAESIPSSRVLINIDFIKPLEAHNNMEFILEPQGDATQVTWAMYGSAPFVAKVMRVFVSMDSLVGKDFAAGLADLQRAAEK